MVLAIPMSGGFDSFYVAWKLFNVYGKRYAEKCRFYNVDYSRPYAKKEMQALDSIADGLDIKIEILTVDMMYDESKLTKLNEIIPLRNLVILSLAAQIPNVLMIIPSVAYGDYSTWIEDKNPRFFKELQATLSSASHGYITIIDNQISLSKSDCLADIIKKDGKSYGNWVMKNTVSCHAIDRDLPCGNCAPCLWKWMMMTNNGMPTKAYFREYDNDHLVTRRPNTKRVIMKHLDAGDHWENRLKELNRRVEQKGMDSYVTDRIAEALQHIDHWRVRTSELLRAFDIAGYTVKSRNAEKYPFIK